MSLEIWLRGSGRVVIVTGERSKHIAGVGGLCGDWWRHIAGQDPEMPSGMSSRVRVGCA